MTESAVAKKSGSTAVVLPMPQEGLPKQFAQNNRDVLEPARRIYAEGAAFFLVMGAFSLASIVGIAWGSLPSGSVLIDMTNMVGLGCIGGAAGSCLSFYDFLKIEERSVARQIAALAPQQG